MKKQEMIDRYGAELTGLLTRIWYAKDAGPGEAGMRLRAANNRIDEILAEIIDICTGAVKPSPPAPVKPPPPPAPPPTPPRAPSPLSGTPPK